MKFDRLVEALQATGEEFSYHPQDNPELATIAPIDTATAGTLSYIEGGKFAKWVSQTPASALILPADEMLQQQATERGIAWIATPNPRVVFARAIALFYQPFKPQPGIHPSAAIDPSAVIGDGVYLGANTVIEREVKIGNGVCIHANAVIYPQVEIGDRTLLHANCTIHERTLIGADCVIHSGAVIGSEGFGFVPTARGWVKMEQSGRTVLEDGVEVGCNSTIDRPAVGETRIGRETKLDNLVHIGHNGKIGQHCAFAAQVGLAGGVVVGNNVLLGGQVGIANQVCVGDGAIATAQTGITNTVAPGAMVSGSPAVPNKIYLKASAIYKRLPDIYQTFKQLRDRLNLLEKH